MATGTFELQIACIHPKCGQGVHIVAIVNIGKDTKPVSLEAALEAAALRLGMRRVHAAGARAQVLCADHTGPIECRRCRFRCDTPGTCGCMGGAQFDVDRFIGGTAE